MDMPEYPSGRSPRRELQGPRPAPLKVRKDSHKIRKPPVAPHPHTNLSHAPPPPRPPVIIYTVSPKIIHANPNEFMSLVQRLTGSNSSAASSSNTAVPAGFHEPAGSLSPAARFASIELTRSPDGRSKPPIPNQQNLGFLDGIEIGAEMDIQRTGHLPGILSPNPNALQPIPPKFFSPPSENSVNPLNYFPDLSPVLHSNRNNHSYMENSFHLLQSPSTAFMISPNINYMPSPNTLDLFHSLFDI